MNSCIFCRREEMREDIVYETGSFFVKVGFGIVAPGHVMLVTKRHYDCFADMEYGMENEHQRLKASLRKYIGERFSEPFIIEYGIWGQSIRHAHEHFIPMRGPKHEVRSIIEEMVTPGGIRFEEADAKKLREIYRSEGSYVSIEEDGRVYVCHTGGLPFPEGRDDDNPYVQHLGYRTFFTKKGMKGVGGWESMTPEERAADDVKRSMTKEAMKGFKG